MRTIPATSLFYRLPEMKFHMKPYIYRVADDGKIIEQKAIRNDLTFLVQLGVVKPSSPEFVFF
jgi:hypothetical protein